MGLQEDKERVREASDIVDIISKYVNLKPSGKNFKANCLFHQEKTPSFFVDPDRQRYHCFGCQADGDVFEFLMKMEGETFPEVLKSLAKQANITLTLTNQPKDDALDKRCRQLSDIMKWASERFQMALNKPTIGAAAKRYLKKRAMPESVVTVFNLGFAPPGRNNLIKAATRDHYSIDLLEQAGLTLKRDDQSDPYDRFRNRLIFPIQDVQGRIVAFGGRVIGSGEPKYLNSPETLIYHKSDHLFGLHTAKEAARKEKQLILVEGYLDVMACYAAGSLTAVASLGTALTLQQARLLKRYADQIIILYDSDEAGVTAAVRAFEIINQEGLKVKALSLKPAKDPDEFIRKYGARAFQQALGKSGNFVEYMLARSCERHDIGSIEGKVSIKNDVVNIIIQLNDRSEQFEYSKQLARRLGQPLQIIEEEAAKALQLKKQARSKQEQREKLLRQQTDRVKQGVVIEQAGEKDKAEITATAEEKLLLAMLLRFPTQIELVKNILDIDIINNCRHQILIKTIFNAPLVDPDEEELWLPQFLNDEKISPEIKNYAQVLVREDKGEEDPWPIIQDCIKRLVKVKLREKEVELQRQIQEAATAGDMEILKQLEQNKFELATRIRQLGLFWK